MRPPSMNSCTSRRGDERPDAACRSRAACSGRFPSPTKTSSTSSFLMRSNSYAGHAVITKPSGTATIHATMRQYQWTRRRGVRRGRAVRDFAVGGWPLPSVVEPSSLGRRGDGRAHRRPPRGGAEPGGRRRGGGATVPVPSSRPSLDRRRPAVARRRRRASASARSGAEGRGDLQRLPAPLTAERRRTARDRRAGASRRTPDTRAPSPSGVPGLSCRDRDAHERVERRRRARPSSRISRASSIPAPRSGTRSATRSAAAEFKRHDVADRAGRAGEDLVHDLGVPGRVATRERAVLGSRDAEVGRVDVVHA